MIGVADPDGSIRNPVVETQNGQSFLQDAAVIIGVPFALILVGLGITMAVYGQAGERKGTTEEDSVLEAEAIVTGELVDTNHSTDEG